MKRISGCSQLAFTNSKLTIETLEQGVKYFQQRNQKDVIGIVMTSLLLILNIFHTLLLGLYCQL